MRRTACTILCASLFLAAAVSAQDREVSPPDPLASAAHLDAFGRVAVHDQGRVNSLDAFAANMMQHITGPRAVSGQSDLFTMFDLIFRPDRYETIPLLFVRNKPMRGRIMQALDTAGKLEPGTPLEYQMQGFLREGLLSPAAIREPEVIDVLRDMNRDLIRTAKYVDALRTAMDLTDARFLASRLTVVPPPGGSTDDRWFSLDAFVALPFDAPGMASLPGGLRESIASAWEAFGESWARGDAPGISRNADALSTLLPQVNAQLEVYPGENRRAWDSWYIRNWRPMLKFLWIPYALCLPPLLIFLVYRWPRARLVGLLLFVAGFALHSFNLALRIYVSGRWPNSNMFEAVTTSVWLGGCLAILFELFFRRTAIRGLVPLGSAGASMVALMCAAFLPLSLSPAISNKMPVLHDVWLYIHTNVIILSYCLIFMASISALLYLVGRGIGLLQGRHMGGEYAKVGGAGSLIVKGPDGASMLSAGKNTTGQILDGTTMILMELSFILLWTGLVMGAIWADHSWGRPWGWDPKEVFALNTFVIFAILIHVRIKVADKGLWTAIIAVIGCIVMLFNWIVINFTISGLHSYA